MDNAGLDGVTHRVLLAKSLGAVRPENEVLLVVLAGVEEQCVALESELSTVLDTGLALAAEVEVGAVAGIGTQLEASHAWQFDSPGHK